MKELGFIVYTLIPKSTKFVQRDKIEIFRGPLTLPLGPWFKIFKIKLHNLIEKIDFIKY